MAKYKKIIIGILVVLLIVIICLFIKTFTYNINIKGDFTSSGAQRNYNASLTFKGNILINGFETYYVGEGGGCTVNCERTYNCKIINQKWFDSVDGSDCKISYPYISITRKGIQHQIISKELKPVSECGHRDLCYEIK